MTRGTRRRLALGSLVVPLVLVACGKKEQPPPPVQKPTAPTITLPTTTTTLPAPTAVPTPVPVWRTLRWGMKKNEVQASLKGEVQRLPKPAPFAQPQPGSRLAAGSSDLEIPVYEADGARFHALFGFEAAAGALNRVHLSAIKPGAGTCRDLETALTGRHGAPTERATTGTTLKGEEIVWKLPDQTVVLDCAGVARLGFVTVTLDYLAPGGDAAKQD